MYTPVSEWNALVVNDVDEEELLNGMTRPILPTELVRLPVEDLSKIAIVSWRWDGKDGAWGSRNLYPVIREVRNRGVRHLFIDVVSIDQSLPGDALIEQVATFTALYKTIPVIAAYDSIQDFRDQSNLRFLPTNNRPWILHEIQSYKFNRNQILYVGHSQQEEKLLHWDYSGFDSLLRIVWPKGFVGSVIYVLYNHVGMSSISDFRYILPSLATVLIPAYEQMCRNDCLLTVAIPCQFYNGDRNVTSIPATEDRGQPSFERYGRSGKPPANSGIHGNGEEIEYFYLDGTEITRWYEHSSSLLHLQYLEPRLDAVQTIFNALGLSQSEFERFTAQDEIRRQKLSSNLDSAFPKAEVVLYK